MLRVSTCLLKKLDDDDDDDYHTVIINRRTYKVPLQCLKGAVQYKIQYTKLLNIYRCFLQVYRIKL